MCLYNELTGGTHKLCLGVVLLKLLLQRLCITNSVAVDVVIEIGVDAAGLFALLIADILAL